MAEQVIHGDGWAVGVDGIRRWGTLGAAGLFLTTVEDGVTLLLVQHRAMWTNFGGTWGIPGGAVDVGETVTEAALRETMEETGVDPADVQVTGSVVTARVALDHVLRRVPLTGDELALAAPVTTAVSGGAGLYDALRDHPVTHPDTGNRLVATIDGELCWEVPDSSVTEWTYTTVTGTARRALTLTPTAESTDLAWCPIDEVSELRLLPPFREALPGLRARIGK
ncbi:MULTISPECIES: NUDIX domain-containing protein [Corynebacterium]|jgi:8-oxo-dGTP pyrophosphatase MutT (NUDIX family)|uniref:8-oxo-dGTP diphosphatase 3 n=1 Tax=Corynebacterium provencense TaxID=1737425 RepID=A0A2Z3YNE7_9CORY|nr:MULTISPECIES: NUDIX hydrolase [Corynebacterium]AWT25866.1 Putative 8-oxo-dGTP diphosphatase 3 [Corynebacterium provencense]MCI1256677.1 NUDIX hydrolase [Corynebacterium provencense]